MHSYHDLNGDIGGFIKKDKLWWYSSLRDQDVQSLLPNFPVKPFETRLQEHHRQGHLRGEHQQQAGGVRAVGPEAAAEPARHVPDWRRPPPFTTAPTRPGTSRTGRTPTRWAGTASSTTRCSSRSTAASSTTCGRTRATRKAPAYQDLTTNIVSGGNQDGWFRDITRNQVLGSLSYFKDGWAGSHNFKFGGEFFNERYDDLRGQDGLGQVPNDVLMVLRNGSPSEVLLFQSPIRVAERSVDDRALRVGRLARELATDVHARPRLRPLPIVPAGADRSAGRSVQCDAGEFPGGRQPDHVEYAGAARSASPTT